jgi:hypothetical protein
VARKPRIYLPGGASCKPLKIKEFFVAMVERHAANPLKQKEFLLCMGSSAHEPARGACRLGRLTLRRAGRQSAFMVPPVKKPPGPRLKDALVAVVAATGLVVVLLIAVPALAWWVFPILWLIVAARVLQGLARRRAVDGQARGKDRDEGA